MRIFNYYILVNTDTGAVHFESNGSAPSLSQTRNVFMYKSPYVTLS